MQNSRREQQKSNWLSFGVSSAMIGGYFGRGGSRLYISSIPCSGWSLWGCPHLRQQPLLEQSLLQCKIHCEETGQENRTNTNMCMRQGGVMGHDTQSPAAHASQHAMGGCAGRGEDHVTRQREKVLEHSDCMQLLRSGEAMGG